jgi:hypothetical protein
MPDDSADGFSDDPQMGSALRLDAQEGTVASHDLP